LGGVGGGAGRGARCRGGTPVHGEEVGGLAEISEGAVSKRSEVGDGMAGGGGASPRPRCGGTEAFDQEEFWQAANDRAYVGGAMPRTPGHAGARVVEGGTGHGPQGPWLTLGCSPQLVGDDHGSRNE
jgi:hypothetical protein